MPKPIFKNVIIAAAGPIPGNFTLADLQRWTRLRRGTFTEAFDDHVTHLLCTKEQFNTRLPRVREGLKRKTLKILDFDWFEISIGANEKLPLSEYCFRKRLALEKAAKRKKIKTHRAKLLADKFVDTNLYRVHYDLYNFPYEVELTRDNYEESGQAEKYTLYLFESIAQPRLYWFAAKHSKCKGDSNPRHFRNGNFSTRLTPQLDYFKYFFRRKTGIDWEDRVSKYRTMPSSCFVYAPPAGGKPVGRRTRFSGNFGRELNAASQGSVTYGSYAEDVDGAVDGEGDVEFETDTESLVGDSDGEPEFGILCGSPSKQCTAASDGEDVLIDKKAEMASEASSWETISTDDMRSRDEGCG